MKRAGRNSTALLIAWCVVTLIYVVLFVRQPLGDLPANAETGQPLLRWAWLIQLLFPGDWVGRWFGDAGRWGLVDRLPLVITAAFIVTFGWAVGRLLLLALLPWDDEADAFKLTGLEGFVFAQATGLSLVSLYVLLAGCCGLLSRWVFLVPAAPVIVVACMSVWKNRGETLPGSQESGPFGPRWLLAALPFAAFILLAAMLPPVNFDVREYHLEAPKEFYQQGGIGFVPHNVYANMPLGAEMHVLLAMAMLQNWWFGALAGKLVIGWFAILTALGLLAAGTRLHSRAAGVVAAVVFLSIPWVVRVSTAGLVEVVWGLYLFLAWYAFVLWQTALGDHTEHTANRPAATGLLVLTGFLAGSALACKYPALLFVVAPLLVWVALETWQRGKQQDTGARSKQFARQAGIYLLAVAAASAPWFAKNWMVAGNPVYPLAYGVFGGETRTPEKDAQWTAAHSPSNFGPRDLLDRGWRFAGASDWQSPLLLPLLLAVVCSPSLHRRTWTLLAFLLWYLACWWLLTHRIDRFWVPLLPLAALAAGFGACWRSDPAWKFAAGTLLSIGLVSNLFFATIGGAGCDPRIFAPLDDLYDDPLRVDPWHLYLNQLPASEVRVMLVGEAEVFDLQVPIVYATVFDDCPFEEFARGKNPEQLHDDLRLEGITHIFVHWGEIERYRSPGNYGFTDYVTRERFRKLVDERVLAAPQTIPGHPGELYVVR